MTLDEAHVALIRLDEQAARAQRELAGQQFNQQQGVLQQLSNTDLAALWQSVSTTDPLRSSVGTAMATRLLQQPAQSPLPFPIAVARFPTP